MNKVRLKNFGAYATVALMAAFLLLMVYALGREVVGSVRTWPADNDRWHYLVAESKRDKASQFAVYNWQQCSWVNSTRASCAAGIRSAAQVWGGEQFAHDVDAAIMRLRLL